MPSPQAGSRQSWAWMGVVGGGGQSWRQVMSECKEFEYCAAAAVDINRQWQRHRLLLGLKHATREQRSTVMKEGGELKGARVSAVQKGRQCRGPGAGGLAAEHDRHNCNPLLCRAQELARRLTGGAGSTRNRGSGIASCQRTSQNQF